MNDYNQLNILLKNKNILYIPIYSCFDYQNGLLNFKADGNINRFLSTFYHINSYNKLTILCPPKGNNLDWFINSCNTILKNVNLFFTDEIKKSAKIERSIEFANKIYNIIINQIFNNEHYDYIIIEAQHLYLKFYNDINYKDKLIYWCPVCATNDKTRDFLEPYKELDKYIFSISSISIIASIDQKKYIKTIPHHGIIFQIESLIDRNISIFNYKKSSEIIDYINKFDSKYKIFLPFRLTDLGYKTKEIVEFLYNEIPHESYEVFYSNPNNCNIYQFGPDKYLDDKFHLVSKDRNTYYTIIDYCNVIIPYFEDIDFIRHASIDEFDFKKCVVVKNIDEFRNIFST